MKKLILISLVYWMFSMTSIAQMPGGVGNSDGTLGQPKNVIWFAADKESYSNGSAVSSLNDLSGNNNDASQPDANRQPTFETGQINSKPAIKFDNTGGAGYEDFMPFDGSVIVNSDYTVMFVGKRRSNGGFRIFLGGQTSATNQNLHLYWNNASQFRAHHYGNDLQTNMVPNTETYSSGTDNNEYGIFTTLLASSESTAQRRNYQNNYFLGSRDNNSKLSSYTGAAFARYTTGYHDVNLAEFIVYSNALNDAQLQIVNQYLNVKYDLAIYNDLFNPTSPYVYDVVGVGSTDGTIKHTQTGASGGGILLAEWNNSFDETNEFIFASHNNAAAVEVATDLPALATGSLTGRSDRIWYVSRNALTTTDASIGFDLSETGLAAGDPNQLFYLLHRVGTSGAFSTVSGAVAILSDGEVWFKVENANLSDGYYTIARSDQTAFTWYSYQSGNWDTWTTWSLEAGGGDIVNPDHLTPTTSPTSAVDKVVVLYPWVVTVSTNDKENALLEVRDGFLNLQSTTGHNFTQITGQGTIQLSADNFPQGNSTVFCGDGGGTVEYKGTGHNLLTARTFNNVKINLTNATDNIYLLNNYTLNGNLDVVRGVFNINNNDSTNILTLDIADNLNVESNGKIRVGEGNTIGTYSIPWNGAPENMPALGQYHAIFHQVRIGGNFTNDGEVYFTNLSAPHYGQFANNGAATLTFYGANDNLASIKNKAYFYNLIIDKGVDKTFILEINSDNDDYFQLFGPNNVGRRTGGAYTAANPEIRKALWIKNGTLKLNGFISIPSLSEGSLAGGNGDYAIPANGALWIDGLAVNNVRIFSTARTSSAELLPGTLGVNDGSSNQAMSVYGEFRITNGYFNTRNSAGFIFWAEASAVVRIEGGLIDVAQFRSAHGGSGGKTSFYMSNGEMFVRGNHATFTEGSYTINPDGGGEITGAYPAFGIIDSAGVFQMTGGTIYINDISGNNVYENNGICINAQVANHTVTGGTFIIKPDGNQNVDIYSRGPLNNLTIDRLNASNTVGVHMSSDLELKGALSINANTQLISRRQHSSFNGESYDLTVAGAFLIASGADYRAINNTTKLYVTYNNNLTLNNTNQEFFNLTIENNPDGSGVGYQKGFNGNGTTLTIHNDLTIGPGAHFNFSRTTGKNILVKGNVNNSGTITLSSPSSNPGAIQLSNRGIVSQIAVTAGGSYDYIPTITIAAPTSGVTATAVPVFDGVPASGNLLPLKAILITYSGSGYDVVPTVTISGAGGATAVATINTQHELGGDGNGTFANLTINEPHPSEAAGKVEVSFLSANQKVTQKLTLTDGILDLENEKLVLDGSLASETISDYNVTTMLRTLAKHSDLGLSRKITSNQTILYPFGFYTKTGDGNRYTPIIQEFTAFVDDGYSQINVVDEELSTLNPSSGHSALQMYWRLRNDGFTTVPSVTNKFYAYDLPVAYFDGAANPSSWQPGKVVNLVRKYNLGPLNWDNPTSTLEMIYTHQDGSTSGATPPPLEEGEFTTGHLQRFSGSVQVFYARQNGNWRSNATWSFTRGGGAATDYPKAGDIAVIRRSSVSYSGLIEVTNTESCAKIIFDDENGFSSGCPRLIYSTAAAYNSNFPVVEVAETHQGGTLNGEHHGAVMQFDLFTGYAGEFPSGDFGDFFNYPNALVIFRNEGATNPINLPATVTEYPQIWFDSPNNKTFILPNDEVVFHGMAIITYGHELRMNSGANSSVHFERRLNIGHSFGSGKFAFNGSASANHTLTADSNINLINSGQLYIVNPTSSANIHKIILKGNLTLENGSSVNLGSGNLAHTNVELELQGNSNKNMSLASGAATVSLYRIIMNKGSNRTPTFSFDAPFTLNGSSSGTSKAIELQNGTLKLNHPSLDLTLSSGGSDFSIPSTAGLNITQGTARITTAGSNGIKLDGYLEVSASGANRGSLILDGGVGSDNYIEYSSSGNAEIRVAEGYLQVGSQIRSSTLNSLGVLKYMQTTNTGATGYSSEVIVGYRSAPVNIRGVFEVMNPLSRFQIYNGTLTIARGHDVPATATRAAFYLDPATVGLNEWGTLKIGDATLTPAGSTITVNAVPTLCDLYVDGNATAQLQINDLSLEGTLNIAAGSTFDGNSLDVELLNDIVNNGTDDLNVDSLMFRGDDQDINGDITMDNLIMESTIGVNLTGTTNTVTVNNDLVLNSGVLSDNGHTVLVKGDAHNEATHNSTGIGRIKLAGSALQLISGTGQFGNLELDNAAGARMMNSFSLNDDFYLTNGKLDIQSHLLTLGVNSDIVGSGFNAGKMIHTNGSFANNGLKKEFPSGAFSFTFPIGIISGVTTKYTPVELVIDANDNAGSVSINPVNQAHMTTVGPNVLQYYWTVNSSGVSNLDGSLKMYYLNSDVVGTESDYISARLVGDSWSKFPVETVDEAQDTVLFTYTGVNNLSGDYTIGIDSDIPNNIPIYESTASGVWSDETIWHRLDGEAVPAEGPQGHIVRILPGHEVTLDRFRVLSYRTEIRSGARLNVGTESGHNLGYLSGSGTLAVVNEKLPAGNYSAFMASGTNNTIEYGGADYYVPDLTSMGLSSNTYNNITFTGTGTKTMVNKRYDILKNVNIENLTTLSTPTSDWFYIGGNFTLEAGAGFDAKFRNAFNGSAIQEINGNFTSPNEFKFFYIYNSNGIQASDDIEVSAYISFYDGVLKMAENKKFYLNGSLDGIFSRSWLDGIMVRKLANGSSYAPGLTTNFFPVAKNNKPRFVGMRNLSTSGDTYTYWTVEYFDANPDDAGYDVALKDSANSNPDYQVWELSQAEYWQINGPASATAQLDLSWGAESGLDHSDLSPYIITEWDAKWISRRGTPAASSATTGTISTSDVSTFGAKGTNTYTLGAKIDDTPLPIELLDFDAQLIGSEVYVSWQTATELNNDYFTVEKTIDGKNFESVGTVDGAGNSNTVLYYQLIDENPYQGKSYYRLKQTDFDGNYSYSELVEVNMDKGEMEKDYDVLVYPNPVTDNRMVVVLQNLSMDDVNSVKVVDLMGKTVYTTTTLESYNGDSQFIIHLNGVQKGFYTLILESSKGVSSLKVLVR